MPRAPRKKTTARRSSAKKTTARKRTVAASKGGTKTTAKRTSSTSKKTTARKSTAKSTVKKNPSAADRVAAAVRGEKLPIETTAGPKKGLTTRDQARAAKKSSSNGTSQRNVEPSYKDFDERCDALKKGIRAAKTKQDMMQVRRDLERLRYMIRKTYIELPHDGSKLSIPEKV